MSLRCLPSSFSSIRQGLGGDVVQRISICLPWLPSWISERNDFSNSESLCCPNASHQVLAESDMVWEKMSFEEFQVTKMIYYFVSIPILIFGLISVLFQFLFCHLLERKCAFCFVLRFYDPVNQMGSCRARSVYLTTLILEMLSPLSG